MDLLELQRHKLIIERASSLKEVLSNVIDERELDRIISKSRDIISKYNQESMSVINPTNMELGIYNSVLKKFIHAAYPDATYDEIHETKFSDYIRDTYILMNRKYPWGPCANTDWYRLRIALLDTIRNSVLKEFSEQRNLKISNYEKSI